MSRVRKRRTPAQQANYNALVVLGWLVVLAFIVFSIWSWFAGPCWLYGWGKIGEMPARCVAELVKQ